MTTDIKTLALVLLLGRIVSVVFISLVLWKQYKLLRLPLEPPSKEINNFRKLLFILSCIILLGNVVPVVIDTLTLMSPDSIGRNPSIPTISVAYALSNSATAAVSAFTIWLLYRTALSSDHNNN